MSKYDDFLAELNNIIETKGNLDKKDFASLSSMIAKQSNAILESFYKFHASVEKNITSKDHYFALANQAKEDLDNKANLTVTACNNKHNEQLAALKQTKDNKIKELTQKLNRLNNAKMHEIRTLEDAYTEKISRVLIAKEELVNNKLAIIAYFNYIADKYIIEKNSKTELIDTAVLELKHGYFETINLLKNEHESLVDDLRKAFENEKDEILNQRLLYETRIHKLTTDANMMISEINAEVKKWHVYGEVPFQIEKNNLLEDKRSTDNELLKSESAILQEFKESLAKIDNLLEQNKAQYLKDRETITRELHKLEYRNQIALQSEKRKLDRNIKKQPNLASKLTKAYKQDIKKIEDNYLKETASLRKRLLKLEISNIKNTELLRGDKVLSESYKSYKMKDLNFLKEIKTQLFEKEQELIAKRLENYQVIDALEESIKILKSREHIDIETIQLQNEVLVLNQKLHILENDLKTTSAFYEKQKEINDAFYLSDFQLKNDILQLDIEQISIEALLNIDRERIIKNHALTYFDLLLADLEAEIAFCHKREKLDISIINTKYNQQIQVINNEIELILANFEIEKTALDYAKLAEIREDAINTVVNIGLAHYNLYVERFTKEKHVLRSSFLKYKSCLQALNNLEESLIGAIKDEKAIKELLAFFLKHRLTFLDDFIDTERFLIEERISFESGIKYDLILQDLKTASTNAIKKHQDALSKMSETVNNYEKTIALFTSNIKAAKDKRASYVKEHKLLAKQNNNKSEQFATLDKIGELDAKIHQYYLNIKNNEASMKELFAMTSNVEKKIDTLESRYRKQYAKTIRYKLLDTRKYYASLTDLRKQKATDRHELKIAYTKIINDDNFVKDHLLPLIKERNNSFTKKTLSRHNQFFVRLYRSVNNEHALIKEKYTRSFAKAKENFNRQQASEKQIIDNRFLTQAKLTKGHNKQAFLVFKEETNQKQAMVISLQKTRNIESSILNKNLLAHQNERSSLLQALDENLLAFMKKSTKTKKALAKKRHIKELNFFNGKKQRFNAFNKTTAEEKEAARRKIANLHNLREIKIKDYITDAKESLFKYEKKIASLKKYEMQLLKQNKNQKAAVDLKYRLEHEEHEYSYLQDSDITRAKMHKKIKAEIRRVKSQSK